MEESDIANNRSSDYYAKETTNGTTITINSSTIDVSALSSADTTTECDYDTNPTKLYLAV